jgi:hypothetical protein
MSPEITSANPFTFDVAGPLPMANFRRQHRCLHWVGSHVERGQGLSTSATSPAFSSRPYRRLWCTVVQYYVVAWMYCGRFAFVGIQMQFQPIVGGNAYEHIAKQYLSVAALMCHFHTIPVFKSKAIRVGRSHVDMALRSDHTTFNPYPGSGAFDENPRCPLKIIRLAYRRIDT